MSDDQEWARLLASCYAMLERYDQELEEERLTHPAGEGLNEETL